MPTVLKLDYDDRKRPPRKSALLTKLPGQVLSYECRKSRSGTGYHVVIKIRKKLTPLQIVAVQIILGSDPCRELYNLYRVIRMEGAPMYWRRRWNVLFRALPKELRRK